jgi:D-alanyl-D-alanine carboxypeptidase
VRQVLGMRSGFPELPGDVYQAKVATDLARDWSIAESIELIPDDAPRLGTPGGAPRYNNVNYQVLALLVEEVSGQPMATAVRTDLLDPAGLERMWFQPAEAPGEPLSVGVDPAGLALVEAAGGALPSTAVASFSNGGGAVAGDAADLAMWGYLLYGGHVIDSALVQQMEADAQPDLSGVPYALGTQVLTDDSGATFVGHAGGGSEWPYTGNLSVWTADPQVAVAVLTPQPADFPTQIYDLVMQLHNAATE